MKVKCISLNVWHGGRFMPEIIDFLTQESADIVLLQEVYDGTGIAADLEDRYRTVEVLTAALGYQYSDFAEAFLQDDPIGLIPQGNAVLTRFPVKARAKYMLFESTHKSYPDTPEYWPIEPRILQHVELETPAGALDVFNMHGVWDIDGDNYSPQRQHMRDVILAATKDKLNVIVGGDSNAKASNKAMQELEPQLTSVFGTELTSTFNMRHKTNPGYATAAVDLLFTSPNFKVLHKECPDVNVSDHLPLIAELALI